MRVLPLGVDTLAMLSVNGLHKIYSKQESQIIHGFIEVLSLSPSPKLNVDFISLGRRAEIQVRIYSNSKLKTLSYQSLHSDMQDILIGHLLSVLGMFG